jgi:Rha family phage regulatory protein
MKELIKVTNGEVTLDSRAIAQHFDKDHSNVLKDIRDEIQKLENGGLDAEVIFYSGSYLDKNNQHRPCYTMTEEGALQLAARYDAVARRKLIVKIKELKEQDKPKLYKELQAIFAIDIKQQEFDKRLTGLEENMTIDFGQQRILQNAAKSKSVQLLGGLHTMAYRNNGIRAKAFGGIWKDFKDYFNIGSYRDTLKTDFEKAEVFIRTWNPNGKLLREIEECNS